MLEDPINHYNRCWADDPGMVQKVICSTCQSEITVFMRDQDTQKGGGYQTKTRK